MFVGMNDRALLSYKYIVKALYGGGNNMELTGKLKEQVEQAKTKEEAKEIIEKAGMILSDEELDQASGGRLVSSIR